MTPVPSDADVGRWVASDFGMTVSHVEPIAGGLDPTAGVWYVRNAEGDEYAVKWSSRRTRTGSRLPRSLAESGLDSAPRTLRSVDGRARVRRADGRLVVSDWLGGPDAATTGLTDEQWVAYGRLLADVHAHRFDRPGGSAQGQRRGIRRRRRRHLAGIRQLDALVASDRLGASDRVGGPDRVGGSHGAVAAAWRSARPRVDLLLAGTRLEPARAPARVPCHGDPHLGNVIVGTDGALRLIDWDEAVVAPREVDLHMVEFSVLFDPLTPAHRAAFRQGYGPAFDDVDEVRMVRFACIRALEDLVTTALAARDAAPEEQSALLETFAGLLSPVGSSSLVEPRLRALLDA